MTQEEKAKRYDEAIERANSLLSGNQLGNAWIYKLLPELAESEDERIRKELIEGFKRYDDGTLFNGCLIREILSWLEKQGEKNLVKHFCDCVYVGCHINDCRRWCHSYKKEISYTDCNSNCNRYSKLMNHAFNIGETITDGISTFKIADIKDNHYIADDGERVEIYMAHRYYTTIQNLEEQKSAWSEEDEYQINTILHGLDLKRELYKKEGNKVEEERYNTQYNWLKSLKERVQPKQEWKQENTSDLTDFENAMMHISDSFFGQHAGLDPNDTNAIKEQANLLLELVPKQGWSEEDERLCLCLIEDQEEALDKVRNDKYGHSEIISDLKEMYHERINFLKSLKDRFTWKPSDEQLEALEHAINCYSGISPTNTEEVYTLEIMKEQLKKLREE